MPTPTRSEPYPTVALLHELPDGTSHVDWLLATDPSGRRPLVTFRLPGRVDRLVPGAAGGMPAERIADHRPVYLNYEGPLAAAPGTAERGPDRGRVRRLRSGRIVGWERSDTLWSVHVEWSPDGEGPAPAGPQHLRLRRGDGDDWHLCAV